MGEWIPAEVAKESPIMISLHNPFPHSLLRTRQKTQAIVGAGYAGLSIARELQKANVSFRLFEARHRVWARFRWGLVGNGGLDYGDYYWGAYRDYYRDPFPHSLLSTRQPLSFGEVLRISGPGAPVSPKGAPGLQEVRVQGLGFRVLGLGLRGGF